MPSWKVVTKMASLPPLFVCCVCGLPVRPADMVSERKAIVWLKAKGTTISEVIEELHEYKHSMCKPQDDTGGIQVALF